MICCLPEILHRRIPVSLTFNLYNGHNLCRTLHFSHCFFFSFSLSCSKSPVPVGCTAEQMPADVSKTDTNKEVKKSFGFWFTPFSKGSVMCVKKKCYIITYYYTSYSFLCTIMRCRCSVTTIVTIQFECEPYSLCVPQSLGSLSSGYSSKKHHGPVEALKQMLFSLQAVEQTVSQQKDERQNLSSRPPQIQMEIGDNNKVQERFEVCTFIFL